MSPKNLSRTTITVNTVLSELIAEVDVLKDMLLLRDNPTCEMVY